MIDKIDLSGEWKFALDKEKKEFIDEFDDRMTLPGTTSYAGKGEINEEWATGYLTDIYKFEGFAWFCTEVMIDPTIAGKNVFLFLERTRVTTIWVDAVEIGSQNSLCSPHVYDLSSQMTEGIHKITICVDNTSYPTKGGHMTSPDTQTNWNGITGRIELQIYEKVYLTNVQVYPSVSDKSVTIKAEIVGNNEGVISVQAESYNCCSVHKASEQRFEAKENKVCFEYLLGEQALLWSEHEPNLYRLGLKLKCGDIVCDICEVSFGLREFRTQGDKFIINGRKTFLRGKHDGMIFPLTGFAPTSVDEWMRVINIAKAYGINHYRFHTCCPPEAAFEAADRLGIYMQPELPFWGSVTDENDENHNAVEQQYLIEEGYNMLKTYANHPSFVMMSLGNELWGSKTRINEIMQNYKVFDQRPLYTQGSNNFQFVPDILENDDFYSGVRFSKDRLIRGSYAMCDAPLGHVQTDIPSTMKDYDENISPDKFKAGNNRDGESSTIEIQYGTGVKTVKAEETEELMPRIPVVSHEIGQYETYPNYNEIGKYKGPLRARNLEIFKQRLEEKGLGSLADKYFRCSGKLAVECYKEELEAALRSRKLAGFQLLDLQDFCGQGTALVGVLDAFMDSKQTVTKEEWCSSCSDAVILARFKKYNYVSNEIFEAHVELCYYRPIPLVNKKLVWELKEDENIYYKGEVEVTNRNDANYIDVCDIKLQIPKAYRMKKLKLEIQMPDINIYKSYDLWVYPQVVNVQYNNVNIFDSLSDEAIALLEKGEKVVVLPKAENIKRSIKGFYCTDFWCYPMFRSISESVNRELPIGTMGLLISNNHPIFKDFISEEYSTYQWWNIVSNSQSIILDDLPESLMPIVQTIDNFERNHKLGMMFECNVLNGKLLICACDFSKVKDLPEVKQFMFSIMNYVRSDKFEPKFNIGLDDLKKLI